MKEKCRALRCSCCSNEGRHVDALSKPILRQFVLYFPNESCVSSLSIMALVHGGVLNYNVRMIWYGNMVWQHGMVTWYGLVWYGTMSRVGIYGGITPTCFYYQVGA